MCILFDKSAPYGLAQYLEGHAVTTAEERGWGRLENGVLLTIAEEAGFEVFLTADKNLRYQQNLSGRKLALVVLSNSPWHLVRLHIPAIVAAINAALPGSYAEVEIPLPPSARLYVRERAAPRGCRTLTWLPFWRITKYPTASRALISRSADTPRGNLMQLPTVSTRPSHNASGPIEDVPQHRRNEVRPLPAHYRGVHPRFHPG